MYPARPRIFLVYPAGLTEFACGLLLVLGYQARAAALVLTLFTLLVTPIFHNFWAVPADQTRDATLHFMKNVAIFGGLLTSLRAVLDSWCSNRRKTGNS